MLPLLGAVAVLLFWLTMGARAAPAGDGGVAARPAALAPSLAASAAVSEALYLPSVMVVAPMETPVTPVATPGTPVVTPVVTPGTPVVTPVVTPETPVVTPVTPVVKQPQPSQQGSGTDSSFKKPATPVKAQKPRRRLDYTKQPDASQVEHVTPAKYGREDETSLVRP